MALLAWTSFCLEITINIIPLSSVIPEPLLIVHFIISLSAVVKTRSSKGDFLDVSPKFLFVTFAITFFWDWFSTEYMDYFGKTGYPRGKNPDNKKGQENSPWFSLVSCWTSQCLKHATRSPWCSAWYFSRAHIAMRRRYPNKWHSDMAGLGRGELHQPSAWLAWWAPWCSQRTFSLAQVCTSEMLKHRGAHLLSTK